MSWVSLERHTFPEMFVERNSSSSVKHVLTLLHYKTALHPAYWAVYALTSILHLIVKCHEVVDVEAGDLCILWARYLKRCDGQTVSGES